MGRSGGRIGRKAGRNVAVRTAVAGAAPRSERMPGLPAGALGEGRSARRGVSGSECSGKGARLRASRRSRILRRPDRNIWENLTAKPDIIMKRLIGAVLLLTAAITCRAAEVGSLRCEYLADPLGIDATRPRLSWIVSSPLRGDRQTAYRVLVASSPELLARGEGDLWDSGKTASARSVQVEYGGKIGRASCRERV